MSPTTQSKLADWAELTHKIVTTLAVLVGAWWTWNQFTVYHEDAPNLQLKIEPRVIERQAGNHGLVIDVDLRNIGKVPVTAGKYPSEQNPSNEGMELSLIEYPDEIFETEAKTKVVDWDNVSTSQLLVNRYNLLKEYTAYQNGAYTLNPGVSFHESVFIAVKPGKLYGIRTRFFLKNGGSVADFAYIQVPTPAGTLNHRPNK